jgi:MGT family glycosyltransferase
MGMRILIASMPFDGHFNPLTGVADHLRARGHDVRWYTAALYGPKLEALGIPHYPFVRATDVNSENLTQHFPEYEKLGLGPKAIAFSLEKIFFGNLEAHLRDVLDLRAEFPFEAIVFDGAFYAGRLIAEKTGVPAYPLWPAPTPAPRSKTAPPPFFGLRPMAGPLGWLRNAIVNKMLESSTRRGMRIWHDLRQREGLPRWDGSVFDLHTDTARKLFMSGVPSMDFPREDWPPNLVFVGALLPRRGKASTPLDRALAEKLEARAGRVVVVAQGTVDNRDPEKLFVPTLEALSGSEYLVVATTGGRNTEQLATRFPSSNVVVVDYVDYAALMPRASLFISNGGYGSVMHALVHGVPLLLAGKSEAKNDINARLDHRGLAIDLKTERPSARQIAQGVARIFGSPAYAQAVARVRQELASYDAFDIIGRAVTSPESRVTGNERGHELSPGTSEAPVRSSLDW